MKRVSSFGLAAILTVTLWGCGGTSVSGPEGKKLTLVRPAGQTLHRGDVNRVAVTVLCENIATDITIRFHDLPDGVKIVEADRTMNPNELVVNFTLHASNDADLVSNFAAKVTAEGPDGILATETLMLTITDMP